MENSAVTKGIRFQRFFYGFLRILLGWIFFCFKRFKTERYKIKADTFLLLSNHNCDYDFFYNVITTRRHMKYVAAEKVTKGFGGWFVRTLVNPIPRRKGAPADEVVELIKENLNAGISVAMFPEGLKSWDGETSFISRRTAALAKDSGAALVTYRIDGDYLAHPAWSAKPRRGPIHGAVVNEYSAEQLAAMSEDEVYKAICNDLYVNAYASQREKMDKYSGKRLAENVEMTCYICPKCYRLGTIHSKNNELYCECGMTMTMNEYGFFEGEHIPFDNVLAWSRWQKHWLRNNAEKLKDRTDIPILTAEDLTVKKNGAVIAEHASAVLYGDRIEIVKDGQTAETTPLADIIKLGSFKRARLYYTSKDAFFELDSKAQISGYRYYGLWRILTGKTYE